MLVSTVHSHLVCILTFVLLLCVGYVAVTLGIYPLVWHKERLKFEF